MSMSRLITEMKHDTDAWELFDEEQAGLIDYALYLVANRPWKVPTIVRTIQQARYAGRMARLYVASADEIEQRIEGYYAVRR